MVLILLLTVSLLAVNAQHARSSPEQTQAMPKEEPSVVQVIRASDWKGAYEVGDEGCMASAGEYTVWVYATATQCAVPRRQADRVVLIRQPTIGVAPITATAQLPGGSYVAWVYGAGDTEHLELRLCAKTCVVGELPTTPAWASLGWIEIRDNQLLFLRSWQQPISHRLHIQAVVLSSNETRPDWVP